MLNPVFASTVGITIVQYVNSIDRAASFKNGYADDASFARHPELWKGLTVAHLPILGPSSDILYDIGPKKRHGSRAGTGSSLWEHDTIGWSTGFNGTDDQWDINDIDQPVSEFSFAVWVRATANPADFDSIMGNSPTSWDSGWALRYSTGSANIQFWIQSWNTNFATAPYTPAAFRSQWHLICGTWDHATIRLFVDLEEGTPDTYSGSMTKRNNYKIGSALGSSARNWPGRIAMAAVWDRVISKREMSLMFGDPAAIAQRKSLSFGFLVPTVPLSTKLDLTAVGDVSSNDGHIEEEPEEINRAARFLRSDPGYFEAAAVPALATVGTMACWFRFTGSTSDYTIWSFSEAGIGTNHISLLYQGTGDVLKLTMNDAGGGVETADKSGVGVVANQWQHVALVANGDTNGYNIYLDGVDVGALSGLDTGKWLSVFAGLDTTNLGVQNITIRDNGLSGDLDEVMYFDSVLSAAEIANLAEGDTIAQLATTYPAIHSKLTHAWSLENNYIAEDQIGGLDLDVADDVTIASPIIKAGDDRGVVFRATDQFGSNDVTQDAIAERPFHVTTRNGKTAWRFPFDTVSSSLRTGTLSDIAVPFTGFIVLKPRVVTAGIRTYMYLENSGSDALGSLVLLADGKVRWRNDFAVQLESVSAVSATVPTIVFFNAAAGGAGELYTNGGTPVTGTVGASPVQAICLGGRFNDFNPADGDIYEAALFTGIMSDAEMNSIGQYAAARYGGTWTDI